LQLGHQGFAGLARVRPLIFRFEHHVAVGDVRRHRIGGDFGGAGAGKDAFHFRHFRQNQRLQALLHVHRLRQAGARHAQRLQGKIPFTEARHKLAAHAAGEHAAEHDHGQCRAHRNGTMRHHPGQRRCINATCAAHHRALFFLDLTGDEQRDGRRDEGHGKQHGPEQSDDHGKRHRMEHFPFDAAQGEDRQVHDHDDQLAKNQRSPRLFGRRKHFSETFRAGQQAPVMLLRMGQTAQGVFDDHHRTVDDDAEVQRAETHQVGADLVAEHAGEGEQHRQRNHHCGNQRGADVAEEQEQNRDHQNRAFDEVLFHRGDGLVDQVRAVVHRHGDHALRQGFIDLFELAGDRLRHGATVLADQHEHRAEHHFTAVFSSRATAQFAADFHGGNVLHPDRRAVDVGHDDVGDVFGARHLPRRTDQQLLAAALDVTGADVGVVALQRRDQIGEREFVRSEAFWVRRNLIFLGETTDGVDLGDTRHVAQLRLDDPVLNHPQIGRCVGRAVILQRALLRFHCP